MATNTKNPMEPHNPKPDRPDQPNPDQDEPRPDPETPDKNPGVNPDIQEPSYPNDQGGVQDNDRIRR